MSSSTARLVKVFEDAWRTTGSKNKAVLAVLDEHEAMAAQALLLMGGGIEAAVAQVSDLAARAFGVSAVDYGNSRCPAPSRARAVASWVMRRKLGMTYPKIGEALGRDHSTIITAVRKVDADSELLEHAQTICRQVDAGRAEMARAA